jgi:hypothetical protein
MFVIEVYSCLCSFSQSDGKIDLAVTLGFFPTYLTWLAVSFVAHFAPGPTDVAVSATRQGFFISQASRPPQKDWNKNRSVN